MQKILTVVFVEFFSQVFMHLLVALHPKLVVRALAKPKQMKLTCSN